MSPVLTPVTMSSDRAVLLLGLAQSLFEGAMYTFVFIWTPSLSAANTARGAGAAAALPFGLIFASFMVCIMLGSALFDRARTACRLESIAVGYLAAAALSLLVAAFAEVCASWRVCVCWLTCDTQNMGAAVLFLCL